MIHINFNKLNQMKKIMILGLAVLTSFAVSCSGGSNSKFSKNGPGAAAEEYSQYILKGEFEKIFEMVDVPEGTSEEELAFAKTMISMMFSEGMKQFEEKKGGLQKMEVLSEEISEDGNTAKVTLEQTFGNGESAKETINFIKKDNKWKLRLD